MRLSAEQFHIEGRRLQEAIEEESLRLARIIYFGEENDMRARMLSYCLREIRSEEHTSELQSH